MNGTSPTSSNAELLLRLEGICKEYELGETIVKALDGVDLEIKRGDYSAILGPSGSGKSTLMHILGFMDQPSKGRMLLGEKDVSRINRQEQAQLRATEIGFVFQSFNLLSRLSVVENVLLPVEYARRKLDTPQTLAAEVLEKVGLSHRIHHRPAQLSGGERQRVAIARALINKPRVLLADEPTGNLDSRNAANILTLFDQLADEGNTLILVTHDESIAKRTRKVIRVLDGKVTEEAIG
ncbi:MAG: ABC transporter ATP-binding protein [Verrucomicrobiota bacterium]